MNEILRYYEDFSVYSAALAVGEAAWFDYQAPSSMHSGITQWAYGTRVTRRCVSLSRLGTVEATVTVPNGGDRYWIKLTACLEEWQKYWNDITVSVNGQVIAQQERELFENVNLGWPGVYYPVPAGVMRDGENMVTVCTADTNDAGLLLASVEVVSLPAIPPYAQISYVQVARLGERYGVAFSASREDFVRVENEVNCTLTDVRFFAPDLLMLQFCSAQEGDASCRVVFADRTVEAKLPRIYRNEDFCLVGVDSDDHRHDLSDEADRIPRIFALSGMGNYFQFRPQRPRNHYELAPASAWEQRLGLLTAFGNRIGLTDPNKMLPQIPALAGDAFFMTHVHEPYLFFNLRLGEFEEVRRLYLHDNEAVLGSESFGESEVIFRDVLRRRKAMVGDSGLNCSIGSPSLLSIYESDVDFEYITLEPVSNINLLVGTLRNKQKWGAHLPPDWYFGVPVDACKARKARLAMQYLYLNGASYVYFENATFKTNAMERVDWESEYCRLNRQYLRDFYTYTVQHPREGELLVDKAVVYGNHEHFYWQNDDRIAELNADGDWDSKVWGKWEDTHRDCWKAIRGWLPHAAQQETCPSPMNKHLFSGTPYGEVDIVTATQDWSGYKTVAFLGWNTMDDGMMEKMKEYVTQGGTLFVSYCHFNRTDRNDRPMTFPTTQEMAWLGVEIGEMYCPEGEISLDGQAVACADTSVSAVVCTGGEAVVVDGQGRRLVVRTTYGKGTVYFAAFKDYFTSAWAVETVQALLRRIGEDGTVRCDNPNVAFTRRRLADGRMQIDLLNMNCAAENGEEAFTLTVDGHTACGRVKEGEPYTVVV
ncbi:MAG: beta-galactosidase trimerization domain-containing protein [Clostridia bacterium]|nr:beta-galactosidase trimerization domain-containing protein [Clostridia bacterium]